jgi:hypothetical protein
LPLAGTVIPTPSRTATEVKVERLAPSTAVFALLSFPRVHGWQDSDVISRDFTMLSQAVNVVPVHGVTVPWGPPFSPKVVSALWRLGFGKADTGET